MKRILVIWISLFVLLVASETWAATSIVKRSTKGSALTWSEMDTNFENLRTAIDSITVGATTWGTITGTLSSQTDLLTELGLKANAASPTFTGTVTIPVTGSTQCLHVNSSGQVSGTGSDCGSGSGGSMVYPSAGIAVSTGSAWGTSLTAPSGAIVGTTDTQTLSAKTLASPAITGTPTAPTAAVDTSTTQLATTAFVTGQAAASTSPMNGTAAVGTSLRYARQDHVHPVDTTRAPLASPTFTGTPSAPTAAANTNTTQVATTAFVIGQASSATPVMNGTAAAGSGTTWSRADHVHPTDTSRQAAYTNLTTLGSLSNSAGWLYNNGSGTMSYSTPAADQVLPTQTGNSGKVLTTNGTASSWGTVSGISSVCTRSFNNLKLSATGTSATITVTADEMVLEDASFACQHVSAVSLSIAGTSTGANGLDTGTLAASTWYSVWVISNGTTTAGLLSLSATAPTLPSGYTAYMRVGWIQTDGTANKYPLSFIQYGRQVQYKVASGSNVTAMRAMSSGAQGSVSIPTWVAVSTSAYVPSTAAKISVTVMSGVAASCDVIFAPNNSYGAFQSTTNPPPLSTNVGSVFGPVSATVALESTNVYWASSNAAGSLRVLGWEDNI